MHEDAGPTVGRGRYHTAQAVVVALLVVGLLTAIFILQNTARAKIHFLFWSASVPFAGALILAVVLGGISGFLVAFIGQRRKARESHARPGKESLVDESLQQRDG